MGTKNLKFPKTSKTKGDTKGTSNWITKGEKLQSIGFCGFNSSLLFLGCDVECSFSLNASFSHKA